MEDQISKNILSFLKLILAFLVLFMMLVMGVRTNRSEEQMANFIKVLELKKSLEKQKNSSSIPFTPPYHIPLKHTVWRN